MVNGNILLLGIGMQGKAALYDLIKNTDCKITVVDSTPELNIHLKNYASHRVKGISLDINSNNNKIDELIPASDIIVEALPAIHALPIAKKAVNSNVHFVTSSYLSNPGEEDALIIDQMQKEIHELNLKSLGNGTTILTEFGLDPGIDLILGKKAIDNFDVVEELNMYGLGIPDKEAANNALNYKFSWSVTGVMKAYLRPACIIRDNKAIKINADEMFNPEYSHTISPESIDMQLECYPNGNSQYYAKLYGIEDTVKNMGRYAGRYPGHCAFWYKMAKSGLLSLEAFQFKDMKIMPVEYLAAFFSSKEQYWFKEDEKDMAFIRVEAKGYKNGKPKHIIYELVDERDLNTGFTAMQRTVGFSMALGARLILEGKINKPGVLTALDLDYNLVLPYYKGYGMKVVEKIV